jgi:hypothetical protein
MYSDKILYFLFIFFGLYAIIDPTGITLSSTISSFSTNDLIRGWGIYSITIGAILFNPSYIKYILMLCFIASIIWVVLIADKCGFTTHHMQHIFINIVGLILAYNIIN